MWAIVVVTHAQNAHVNIKIQSLWCWYWNIPGHICQYYGCWHHFALDICSRCYVYMLVFHIFASCKIIVITFHLMQLRCRGVTINDLNLEPCLVAGPAESHNSDICSMIHVGLSNITGVNLYNMERNLHWITNRTWIIGIAPCAQNTLAYLQIKYKKWYIMVLRLEYCGINMPILWLLMPLPLDISSLCRVCLLVIGYFPVWINSRFIDNCPLKSVESFSTTLLTMRWQIEMSVCNMRAYDDWCPASHVYRLAYC